MLKNCCKKKNNNDEEKDEGEFAGDENTVRGNWSNKLDCIVALISYSVGFGNVWRFPYLCYRNGGGAFLIPYFFMLAIAGIPLYFLELIISQYSSLGPIQVWNLSPLFRGVGFGAVLVTGVINVYYCTLVAYSLFYFFASMTSVLPWSHCNNAFNTPACRVDANAARNGTSGNFSLFANDSRTLPGYAIVSSNISNTSVILKAKSPAEEYFDRYVLDISDGIEDLGPVRWQLALCLLLGWVICFCILIKGIKSAGKVAYFTATFPYFILFALLIRGLTLEGSMLGLRFYLIPEWEKLATSKVWADAAAQIFYSLGPCWGGLIAFGSYNNFHNNILRDTLVCSLVCCGTSFLAGCVIFSIIGFMAYELNVTVGDVMTSGPGLAFVAYPEALARMPVAPLWSLIFFAMLLCAGISSLFTQTEMLVVSVTDMFPSIRKRKMWFTMFVCFMYYLIGLPQVTRGGMYILNLLDWYIALFSIIIIGLIEVIVVAWIYGYKSLSENARIMLGKKPSWFFVITWCFVCPVVIVTICVFNAVQHTPAVYNDYVYPDWSIGLGWTIAVLPIMPIPLYMLYLFAKHVGSWEGFKETISLPWTGATLRQLVRPNTDWGPMMPLNRKEAGLPPLSDVCEPLNTIIPTTEKEPVV